MNKRLVAILIPLSNRTELTEAEKISLRHLEFYLEGYDKFFLAPEHLEFSYHHIPVTHLPGKYFGSLKAHNRLLLSKEFYERFTDYKFILIYHLDSLVFEDSLEKWCSMNFDYIAPPWIKGPDLPWLQKNGVGNGGFSLRKVDAFIRLFNSNVKWMTINKVFKSYPQSTLLSRIKHNVINITRYLTPGLNTVKHHAKIHAEQGGTEDRFIWKNARKYDPDFSIAPVDTALEFAFESNLEICYEMNGYDIPFGCHAWERYNKDFWEPYLLK